VTDSRQNGLSLGARVVEAFIRAAHTLFFAVLALVFVFFVLSPLIDCCTLQGAINEGSVTMVRLHLKLGADPSARDEYSWTPLHTAVRRNRAPVVRALLEGGADPNARDKWGDTPLHDAAGQEAVDAAGALLDGGADVNARDGSHRTPLDVIAERVDAEFDGHDERMMVELLIRRGGTILQHDASNLHWAATVGNADLLELVMAQGPDVDGPDSAGRTPLHYAATYGNAEVVRLLLRGDAGKDVPDAWGRTPLHYAAGRGHADAAKILLRAGAKTDQADNWDWTPLDYAMRERHDGIASLLRYYSVGQRR